MGYIKHDTIICTAWDDKYIKPAHEAAKEFFSGMVSEIIPGIANGQKSFFIPPDGSKEGWDASDKCDEARENFLDYLKRTNSFVDWVHLRFGGDDDGFSVNYGGYEESRDENE
jgi:hypothetical protein